MECDCDKIAHVSYCFLVLAIQLSIEFLDVLSAIVSVRTSFICVGEMVILSSETGIDGECPDGA